MYIDNQIVNPNNQKVDQNLIANNKLKSDNESEYQSETRSESELISIWIRV